jgi:hypothetical protein
MERPASAGLFCRHADYGFTGGCAFLLAASTALAASFFISSIFIESVFTASAGADDVVVEGAVVVGGGAGVGAGAGAGAGAGVDAGVGAGGGGVSFLPQAASATTIIEASNSDLFISYEPFMVVR